MIEGLRQLPEEQPVGRRYLVGVSGGVDSVVLLHALHTLGYRRLVVVHVNHGLRGRASGHDAVFVRHLVAHLDYQLETTRVDVRALATTNRLSIETAAREARRKFFGQVAQRYRCPRLFLAHHADDQVETVLMNLFRGSGTGGLGGMRVLSHQCMEGKRLAVLRPLLGVTRDELIAYAEGEGIRYREDASNTDAQFLRNRVRHELIPFLGETFGRDIRGAILRLAVQCQAESDCLDGLVAVTAEEETLAVAEVRALPLALQRRLLHRWLRARGVEDLSFDVVEKALTLIDIEATLSKINLPRDRYLRRRQRRLFVV